MTASESPNPERPGVNLAGRVAEATLVHAPPRYPWGGWTGSGIVTTLQLDPEQILGWIVTRDGHPEELVLRPCMKFESDPLVRDLSWSLRTNLSRWAGEGIPAREAAIMARDATPWVGPTVAVEDLAGWIEAHPIGG